MKLIPASLQVRLDSFSKSKTTRRSSSRSSTSRSKKAAPKKTTWPLTSPSPIDLAFAGFQWAPSTSSPDNVKCVYCDCQLDGWEESDVPAHEHLTHSPNCGYAINACIRLRNGDPARVEEDPLSDKMNKARETTFGDYWPLDTSAGFPSVEQMVTAGWVYDPTPETPDAVTCPYCSLSLDSWDAGDSPYDEHLKRASDCLFFTLKELYHPVAIPHIQPAPAKKAPARKRASSRSKPAPAPKRAPTPESPPDHAPSTPPAPAQTPEILDFPLPPTRTPETSRKRKSDVIEAPDVPEHSPKKMIKLFGEELEITSAQLDMTVEEWFRYNAEEASEHLREEFERQIETFDAQGRLALEKIDAIPVC